MNTLQYKYIVSKNLRDYEESIIIFNLKFYLLFIIIFSQKI